MEKQSKWNIIQTHMLTGVGYMIPVIMASSLMQSLCLIIGNFMGVDVSAEAALTSTNAFIVFLANIDQVYASGFQNLMYVVLAGYIAFSIADRNGLVPGMLAGYMAASGSSGFLGALAGGFLAGYFIKWMEKVIHVSRSWRTLFMFMIYPMAGAAVIFTAMYFVIDPIGGAINSLFVSFINYVGAFGMIPLYFILAGMMAADLGGPINKAAFSVSFMLAGSGFPLTATMAGAMVAPLGFGLAALIDKFALKNKYLDEELTGSGLSSFVMGLFNITEGAIPMLLSDPGFMLPVNILGSGLAAITGYLLDVNLYLNEPMGNLIGMFSMAHPFKWIFCLLVGAGFIAACILFKAARVLKKTGHQEDAQVDKALD